MNGINFNYGVRFKQFILAIILFFVTSFVLLGVYHIHIVNKLKTQSNTTNSLYKEGQEIQLNNATWKIEKLKYVAGKYEYFLKCRDHEMTIDEYTLKRFQHVRKN